MSSYFPDDCMRRVKPAFKGLKPGSHLYDTHNTGEISIRASTSKGASVCFFCVYACAYFSSFMLVSQV